MIIGMGVGVIFFCGGGGGVSLQSEVFRRDIYRVGNINLPIHYVKTKSRLKK